MRNRTNIQTTYDAVATDYAEAFFSELVRKPFDCALLDRYASFVRGHGVPPKTGGQARAGRRLKAAPMRLRRREHRRRGLTPDN